MNINSIKDVAGDIVAAGKAILPLIVPGAGPIIEAGERIASALDKIVDIDGAPDAAETRDQLRDRVNANLDRAIGKLA